jgi:hypothetical protein
VKKADASLLSGHDRAKGKSHHPPSKNEESASRFKSVLIEWLTIQSLVCDASKAQYQKRAHAFVMWRTPCVAHRLA